MKFAWRERIRLLRSLTFSRTVNLCKLFSSYLISNLIGRPILWGLPISIAYEPTTSCNLRCPECPSGLRSFSRPIGNSNLEEYKSLINEVRSHITYLTLYFQGEPYLNNDLFSMINFAYGKKIYTSISTNAHYLTEENARKTVKSGLDKLIISLDGISQESYSKYRIGGDLDKVVEGVKTLVKVKKQLKSKFPFIVIQTIAFSHNEDELEEIKSLKDKWGVDAVLIKTAQVYDPAESNLLPKDSNLSRYKKIDGKYSIENNAPNHCWRLWSSPVITQDGQMLPCCFDKDAEHSMGIPKSAGEFRKVWSNKKYSTFRKQVYLNRKAIDICKNCSEGVKVWN